VTFIGDVDQGKHRFTMKVLVPVTSLHPVRRRLRTGAHNQRSHVTVTARTSDFVWIEDIVDVVEAGRASCMACSSARTKNSSPSAYDNPKFVEDMVRDVAAVLIEDERIEWYVVESENFESIHNHSACADRKDKEKRSSAWREAGECRRHRPPALQ
jgi:GTP cyclohydrolase I